MELLLNGLMRQGAQRDRLEAKVFGGARMMQRAFRHRKKEQRLRGQASSNTKGIHVVGGDIGGERGRRMQFWPVSGRALQSYIHAGVESLNEKSKAPEALASATKNRAGEIDLF